MYVIQKSLQIENWKSPVLKMYMSVYGVQKVAEQTFGAYLDLWCYNRPRFGPFWSYFGGLTMTSE